MKTLQLTLKKKWFDMIASGEKKEEYREIKIYWIKRLLKIPTMEISGILNKYNYKEYNTVTFRHGYSRDAPVITLEFKGIEIGKAKSEWSDNWQGEVFIIKLGEIIS